MKQEIIINGKEVIVGAANLTYSDLLRLAFRTQEINPNNAYTVTYHNKSTGAGGSLVKGQSVKVESGMVFNVALTNNA